MSRMSIRLVPPADGGATFDPDLFDPSKNTEAKTLALNVTSRGWSGITVPVYNDDGCVRGSLIYIPAVAPADLGPWR